MPSATLVVFKLIKRLNAYPSNILIARRVTGSHLRVAIVEEH